MAVSFRINQYTSFKSSVSMCMVFKHSLFDLQYSEFHLLFVYSFQIHVYVWCANRQICVMGCSEVHSYSGCLFFSSESSHESSDKVLLLLQNLFNLNSNKVINSISVINIILNLCYSKCLVSASTSFPPKNETE